MRYQILFLAIVLIFLISCGDQPEKTRTENTGSPSTAISPKTSANSPLGTNTTPTPAKINEGASIAPIVQGYYDALRKKDEAGAKKFLSAAALKYYEDEAKSEKKNWFAFVLEENDPVEEKREVQNEKIEGNKAVAEVKGGSLGTWTKIVFVKEGNEWKFASPAETIQETGVKKTESLPTPAK